MRRISKRQTSFLLALIMILSLFFVPGAQTAKAAGGIKLSGMAHVQTFADQAGKVVNEGGVQTLVLGTRGKAKRVESVTINLVNDTGYEGTLQYRVHRQTYGWTNWMNAGNAAGTTGQGKRLEGIQMRLTGELAKHYDVRYCAHIQTYGDMQGWVYNGALAGTTGEAKRLEEIKVQIVPKSSVETEPSVSYRVHRQTYGWEKTWAKDGAISGTTGQGKRLEGITITVNDNLYSGGITYRTQVQSYGWLDWVENGEMSGTQGKAKRLEAIQIKLTGELANHYDVYYRVHAQSYGWMGWAKNGEYAGTESLSKRLEAVQIVILQKGKKIHDQKVDSSVSVETYDSFVGKYVNNYDSYVPVGESFDLALMGGYFEACSVRAKYVSHDPKAHTITLELSGYEQYKTGDGCFGLIVNVSGIKKDGSSFGSSKASMTWPVNDLDEYEKFYPTKGNKFTLNYADYLRDQYQIKDINEVKELRFQLDAASGSDKSVAYLYIKIK